MFGKYLLLSVILTTFILSGGVDAMTLAKNGMANCRIVVSDTAIRPEVTAANELASYLKQVTGASFDVVTESKAKPTARKIFVGQTKAVMKNLPGINWKSLGYDGIVIKTIGNDLVLAGGRPRGALYAVYTFLEDTVGCRWLTSSESDIPKKPTLTIPALNIVYTPKVLYREPYYQDIVENPIFAARLKTNGNFSKIPQEYGGHYSIIGWCHTFYELLPPSKYFKDHPEWYSEIGGKRTAKNAQLCLTNDEMREELVKEAIKKIDENPNAGIISIAQNDCGGRCECPKCKALEEKEGSPSGPLIHFVNAVAEEIEKKYPEVWVETLAYTYTRKPPLNVRPRKNVVVRLCTIECSFVHPLENDINKDFRDDMLGWSAISPNLYIWDYVTDFANYIQPQPNIRVLAPNIRFFVKNKAIGIFEQGDVACSIGDFVRLRAWLLAHLLWNPSLDQDKLINEFLNGYYGDAAPYLLKYLNLVIDAGERKGTKIGCYNPTPAFLNIDDMNEATRLFDKAESAVKNNPTFLSRVKRERLSLDYAWIACYRQLKKTAEKDNKLFLGPVNPEKAVDDFIAAAKSWNVKNFNEAQGFEASIPAIREKAIPLESLSAELKAALVNGDASIPCNQFKLINQPDWVSIVDDQKAYNGKAARMPGEHNQWAVQWNVPGGIADIEGKWHCYVSVKCDALEKTGIAFSYGIYDAYDAVEVVHGSQMLENVNSDYQMIDLGVHSIDEGMYFWVAPPGNENAVKDVCVDKIVLKKE